MDSKNKRNTRGNSAKRVTETKKQGANKTSQKKRNKKGKFKNTRLFKILRVALVVIILIIIINIIADVTKNKSGTITLIIGDEQIELKYELLIDDNTNIYMSKDDIANLYDENIYYSEEDQTLITTYNKHVAKLEIGKTTMEINSTETAISGTLKEEDGVIYLPFTDLNDVYDFEYEYNSDENILLVDSISTEKSEAIVLKTSKVKEEPKTFSKTLEKITRSSGQYVTVFGTEGDYTKVRTSAGNIGYIKTSKLSEVEVLWEDMEEETLENVKVLSEYNVVDSYDVIETDSNYTNIVIPNLFNINENLEVENVIDLSSSKYENYKTWAESSGVSIAATVTLSASMNEVCSSYTTRTCLINLLYNQFVNNQISIICIDFDDVDDTEGFYRFIIELTPRFKEIGYKVVVKYKNGLNKERLENIVDYVIE